MIDEKLKKYIEQKVDPSYKLSSRIHPLMSLSTEKAKVYIKREDELSFGISGLKYRKYSSLIPFLLQSRIQKVIVEGSSHSNHIVGIMQLLTENKIKATLVTTIPYSQSGNYLFARLLAGDCPWIKLSKEDWKHRNCYIKPLLDKGYYLIKEGGDCFESLPGMMTLSRDIENVYDHIFIDAGTFHSAISLILSSRAFGIRSHIHVIAIAKDDQLFSQKLQMYKKMLEDKLLHTIEPAKHSLHSPVFCKSFGSTNKQIFQYIKKFAEDEGIFLDPIYSSKLMMNASMIIRKDQLKGKILVIHSGGALSLSGFTKELEDLISFSKS